jgi:hypothetical protein
LRHAKEMRGAAAADAFSRSAPGFAPAVEILGGQHFHNVRWQFTLDTDASEDALATLLRLAERYCVACQALAYPRPR